MTRYAIDVCEVVGMSKLVVMIPDGVHEWMRSEAKRDRRSVTAWLTILLEKSMRSRGTVTPIRTRADTEEFAPEQLVECTCGVRGKAKEMAGHVCGDA